MGTKLTRSVFTDLVAVLSAVGTIGVIVIVGLLVGLWLVIQANLANISVVPGF